MKNQLGEIVGKRISKLYLRERTEGPGMQIFLVFADSSYCELTNVVSGIEITVSDIFYPDLVDEVPGDNFRTVKEEKFDADGAYSAQARTLFHTLWSKAVGADDYEKQEWRDLGTTLVKSGIDL